MLRPHVANVEAVLAARRDPRPRSRSSILRGRDCPRRPVTGSSVTAPAADLRVCDPPTLARDARKLLDAGYRIASIRAFDLFPHTPHVETVVVFDR